MGFDTEQARQYVDQSAQKLFEAAAAAGDAAKALEEQQAELERRSQSFDAAWKQALEAGWSEADLRKIGLTKPRARRRASSGGKPRNARTTSKPNNDQNPAAESAPQAPSDNTPQ